NIDQPALQHKRYFGTPAMHYAQVLPMTSLGWKEKKAPSEDGACRFRAKPKIESGGKWTREEETPFADGPGSREEEERSSVRCRSRGPREEETGRVTSTRRNMLISGGFSNAAPYMSAMRL